MNKHEPTQKSGAVWNRADGELSYICDVQQSELNYV